jgi:tetratricopeptide (TPR) repeat protein
MMILDNADDLTLLSGCFAQDSEPEASSTLTDLFDYIPNCSSNGSILFTTRSKVNALQLTSQGKTIHVSKMSAEDSISLLRAKFSGEFSNEDGWKEMLVELEYLPLAIVQAASFIRQNCWTVPQYMRHVREKGSGSFPDILLHDFRDKHREKGVTNAVLKTWIITVEQLESQYPIAADVLWRTAYLDGQNIPHYLLEYSNDSDASEELLGHTTSPLELELAIGTLKAYSFISTTTDHSTTGMTYTIHRLVQLFSRYWIQFQKEVAPQILTRTVMRLCETFPRDAVGRESWPRSAEIIPHVQTIVDYQTLLSNQHSRFCDLLGGAASYLSSIGNLSAAIDLIYRAVAFSQESPTSKDLDMRRASLRLMSQLADYKRKEGNLKEAEADQRRLLAETKDVHGPRSPHTLRRLAALGDMLNDQGRYPEAEQTLRLSIKDFEDLQLGDHVDALNAKKYLARNLRIVGKLDEAERLIREVLQVIQSPEFHDKSNERSTLAELSLILDKKHDYAEAETVDRQLIALSKERWGLDHHKTLRHMCNLGVTLKSLSRFSEAMKQFSETLNLQETALGYNHEDTLHTAKLAGFCLYSQGKYIEAVKYMQRAHDGYAATKGPTSSQALQCAKHLEKSLQKAGLTEVSTNDERPNKGGHREKGSDESDDDSRNATDAAGESASP